MAQQKPTAAQLQAALKDYMRRIAAKGGKRGGKARMAQLTTDERRALALKAIRARWSKAKKGKPR
jgi:hypothetical protein